MIRQNQRRERKKVEMKKAVVVYYSWSNGNTKRIAEQLAEGIGAISPGLIQQSLIKAAMMKSYPRGREK